VPVWLGVDVGGRRKGFDAALVDEARLLDLRARLDRDAVLALVDAARPAMVAVDSPRSCAPDGERSRACERDLVRAGICQIRWTPDGARVHAGDPYYAWVVEGLRLYAALAERDVDVIEVFPTASWTRWYGPRDGRSRSSWTHEALAALGLAGVPARTNQDQRDAIAAAVTAREYSWGSTEAFGEIIVPARQPRSGARGRRASRTWRTSGIR
jgi:predicted nuclease with RNAse H fold